MKTKFFLIFYLQLIRLNQFDWFLNLDKKKDKS